MKGWALVTGGAKRIGHAIVLELAERGFDIVIHYHHSAEEAEELAEQIAACGRKVVLAEIDLANRDHVAKLIPSLTAEIGTVTALVNNASLFEPDAKDPDGSRHWAVNFEAPKILSQAFYEQGREGFKGAIVNLLDGCPPEEGFAHYLKSKRALQDETLLMAKRFAPYVRVNGVAPGPVLPNARQSERHHQGLLQSTPLQTPIEPEDIARATSFLLTSQAITGNILYVNNGAIPE